MSIKRIKNLAKASFIKNKLDEKKTLKIGKLLKRGDLKKYINEVKRIDKQNTVNVYFSNLSDYKIFKKRIEKMFETKEIKLIEDKSLIAGIKVEDNDDIYEYNLKTNIGNIVNYISE